jgi:hypothetical protein
VVIDSNGIHEVALDYCGCEGAKSALYPVTSMNPKSAATFRAMKFFHILSFESKCSGYEFYKTLARYTDNVGVNSSRVSARLLTGVALLKPFRIVMTNSCE